MTFITLTYDTVMACDILSLFVLQIATIGPSHPVVRLLLGYFLSLAET